jgi:hypothetical protein
MHRQERGDRNVCNHVRVATLEPVSNDKQFFLEGAEENNGVCCLLNGQKLLLDFLEVPSLRTIATTEALNV